MRLLDLDGIKRIPRDRVVTYARIVVDYRPQKEDPNRVRITAGGNLIQYPGEQTTRTADTRTSKIIWNSTISTRGARYMVADAGNFYIDTPMERKDIRKRILDIMHFEAQLVPMNISILNSAAVLTPVLGMLALACAICTSGFEDSLLHSKSTLDLVLFDLALLVSPFSLFVLNLS